jgi:Fe-S oxidoreductase
LPELAQRVAQIPGLAFVLNLRNRFGVLRRLSERWFGMAAARRLPEWRARTFAKIVAPLSAKDKSLTDLNSADVVLWADTFNNAYEPEHLQAALAVMRHLGLKVAISGAAAAEPLCCGRTSLSVGMIDEAKAQAEKTLAALKPALDRGVPIVGLEPSCVLGFRDEWLGLGLGDRAQDLSQQAMLFEEWWMAHGVHARAAVNADLAGTKGLKVLVHGHCHQKAMGVVSPTLKTLESLGFAPELVQSSCCGMAGSFGYDPEHLSVSMAMAEAELLPAVRQWPADTLIVADGFSCRHQISDGAQRQSVHVAQAVARALGVG